MHVFPIYNLHGPQRHDHSASHQVRQLVISHVNTQAASAEPAVMSPSGQFEASLASIAPFGRAVLLPPYTKLVVPRTIALRLVLRPARSSTT